jgi:hypothetical protein
MSHTKEKNPTKGFGFHIWELERDLTTRARTREGAWIPDIKNVQNLDQMINKVI